MVLFVKSMELLRIMCTFYPHFPQYPHFMQSPCFQGVEGKWGFLFQNAYAIIHLL